MKKKTRLLIGMFFFVILASACNPAAIATSETITETQATPVEPSRTPKPTVTPSPTILSTPTPTLTLAPTQTETPSQTPIPENASIFVSKIHGISILYPTGWEIRDDKSEILMIEDEVRGIFLTFFPAEAQEDFKNNPILALEDFIWFSSLNQPDKERVHIVIINGSEFAFGVYSTPGEAVGFSNPNPLFMAMTYTDKHIIIAEFATGENFSLSEGYEEENRAIFEMVLASLPPSITSMTQASTAPTMVPLDTLNLPENPSGFGWQGVPNIEFAVPVPEGWFVRFNAIRETWQNGLQEYEYEYLISPDNPVYSGRYEDGMSIQIVKNNSSVPSSEAVALIDFIKSNPLTNRVIISRSETFGNKVVYHLHIEAIHPVVSPDDPEYNRTIYFLIIVDDVKKLYISSSFDSNTRDWEANWAVGEVMSQLLQDFVLNNP